MQYYLDLVKSVREGDIAPVYLFYGDEVFLHARAVEMLRGALLTPAAAAFDCDVLDGEESEPAAVVRAAETAPVLGTRRLVIVRHAPGFSDQPGKSGERGDVRALEAYLENPAGSTCLVLVHPGPVDRRRRLFRLVAEKGRAVDFTPLSDADRLRWVAKRVREAGKTAAPPALRRLVVSSTGGLAGLEQDLNKVLCYVGERPGISEDDVAALVIPPAEETVFAVIDALGEGKARPALEGLAALLRAGEEPLRLLGMLARQFRIILAAGDLSRRGMSAAEIARELGLKTFVVRRALEHGRMISPERAARTLAGIRDIDLAVKNGRRDFYSAAADLILQVCAGNKK